MNDLAHFHQVLAHLRAFLAATRLRVNRDEEAWAIMRAYQLGTYGTVADWELPK